MWTAIHRVIRLLAVHADSNNVYTVSVEVRDGNGGNVVQNITIAVNDGNDAPTFVGQQGLISAGSDNSASPEFAVDENTESSIVVNANCCQRN